MRIELSLTEPAGMLLEHVYIIEATGQGTETMVRLRLDTRSPRLADQPAGQSIDFAGRSTAFGPGSLWCAVANATGSPEDRVRGSAAGQ